jgi:flagellar basal body-associated protein FliL
MTEDLAASSAKTDQIARIGIIIVAVAVLVALLVAFVVTVQHHAAAGACAGNGA